MASLHPKLDDHHRRWRSKPVLRAIYADYYQQILGSCAEGTILEVGAGSGHFSDFANNVVQIDILWTPWLDLVADAQRLPFANQSFDNIVMIDVLHHIQYPQEFLKEAERVLRPCGRIVLLEPGITPLSWVFYNFLHEEDVDLRADPFQSMPDRVQVKDAWESNQAVPTLLFARGQGRSAIHREIPNLRIVNYRWYSLFAYPLSGGFQRWSLLPRRLVKPLLRFEAYLLPLLGPLAGFRLITTIEKVSLVKDSVVR